MRCWRFGIKKRLPNYIDAELSARDIKRVEDHLLDCSHCRAQLLLLKNGKHLLQHLPPVPLENDPWKAISAAISAPPPARGVTTRLHQFMQWQKLFHPITITITISLLTLGAVYLIVKRDVIVPNETSKITVTENSLAKFEAGSYRVVSISEIENNTAPHIMMEGFVSEVNIEGDGDTTFRLVEDLKKPNPFIVCEIISPLKISLPPLGSKVRVYGVSRFDSEEDHNWHEVHPVLNIEIVSR